MTEDFTLHVGDHPVPLTQVHADMGPEELFQHLKFVHRVPVTRILGASYAQAQHERLHAQSRCEHRWTPWRRIVQQYDCFGDVIPGRGTIAELSGVAVPTTPGWSRACRGCFLTEHSHGSLTEGADDARS